MKKLRTTLLPILLLLLTTNLAAQSNWEQKRMTNFEKDITKINKYIADDRTNDALEYLEQIIPHYPEQICDLANAQAIIYIQQQNYEEAIAILHQTLFYNPHCELVEESLATTYILEAQDYTHHRAQATTRKEAKEIDNRAILIYLKAATHLENIYKKQIDRNAQLDEPEVRITLTKLRNVYYNLCLLNVDKAEELEQIEKTFDETIN